MFTRSTFLVGSIVLGVFISNVHGGEPLAKFEPTYTIKLGWPEMRASSTDSASACPQVAGIYHKDGDGMWVVSDDGKTAEERRGIGSNALLFGHPRSAKNGPKSYTMEPVQRSERSGPDTFSIIQTHNAIQVRELDPKDNTLVMSVLHEASYGDYKCGEGKVVFVPRGGSGNSEGTTHTYEAESFIAPLTDGSLLLFESSRSSSRSLFIFSSTRSVKTYVRFLPKKKE